MKEIKASDLRIGNLVNYKYYNPDPKAPDWAYEAVEIVEIKQSHLVFRHLNKKAKFKIAVLYPIPLTEERLERFGFRKIKVNSLHNTFNSKKISILQRIKDSEFWYQDTKIESVNHLQNLYHALTGEELTINN